MSDIPREVVLGSIGRPIYGHSLTVVGKRLKNGKWRAYVISERNPITGIYGSYSYNAVRDLDWKMINADTLEALIAELQRRVAGFKPDKGGEERIFIS